MLNYSSSSVSMETPAGPIEERREKRQIKKKLIPVRDLAHAYNRSHISPCAEEAHVRFRKQMRCALWQQVRLIAVVALLVSTAAMKFTLLMTHSA